METQNLQETWEAKEARRAVAARELQAKHPYLVANRDMSARICATKNIRIELKRAFPGVKFSVTSSTFSMGNSIDVSWKDGPTSKAIDKIIDKYNAGSFDGMTDCYNYSHSTWNDAFGDAKYVHSRREYSDSLVQMIINQLAVKYAPAQAPSVDDFRNGRAWNTSPVIDGHRVHDAWQTIIHQALDLYDCCKIEKAIKGEETIEQKIAKLEAENRSLSVKLA